MLPTLPRGVLGTYPKVAGAARSEVPRFHRAVRSGPSLAPGPLRGFMAKGERKGLGKDAGEVAEVGEMRRGGDAERGEPRCSRKRGQTAAETLAGVGEETVRWGAMPGKVNEEKKEDEGKKKNTCKWWSPKEGI